MPVLSPGDVFGDYRVAGVAGSSDLFTAYGATDIRLGRPVTLKLLSERVDDGLRERYADVSRRVARLKHPNVVAVLEVGDEGGHVYVALGHVAGRHLGALLEEEGPFDAERAVAIVAGVAAALDAAHAAGIVHGDVSPRTVLVARNGGVQLTDFGLAEPRDARADVDALGALLFLMLSGHPPDRGGPPPAPGADTPPLDAVLVRALAEDPARRFQSAGELARAAAAAVRPMAETRPGVATVVQPRPGAPLGGILSPTDPLGTRKVRPEEQPTVPRPVMKPPPS